MARTNKGSQKAIKDTYKSAKALELRLAGHTYQQIADAIGYSDPSAAYKAVQSGLDRTLREPADAVRQMELDRLDRMLRPLLPKADTGDLNTVEVVLKLMQRRARYLGLDAPTKIDNRVLGEAKQAIVEAEQLRQGAEVLKELGYANRIADPVLPDHTNGKANGFSAH